MQSALAKANNTAEETISAMKTVRSFANEETEANVYWQKLQQVYKLNKREAMAYTYYVWSSGVGGWPWGWDGQGSLSRSQSWFSSTSREPCGVSPALLSTASNPQALNHLLFSSIKKIHPVPPRGSIVSFRGTAWFPLQMGQ